MLQYNVFSIVTLLIMNVEPTPFETHSRRSTVYGTRGMVASS
jgi:hypothetical protein